MNLEKISTKNSFGKSKRFGIVDFMRQQGQVGVSPGVGSYSPKNHEINKVINEKPDLRRMIAVRILIILFNVGCDYIFIERARR